MAGVDQKDRCSGMYKAGIDGDNAPRAVFSSLVGWPGMLGILAGMDQEDCCSGDSAFFLRPLVSGSHMFGAVA